MTMSPLFTEPPDWDAIARFRAGESVGNEARRVAAWLEAHPGDTEMLAALDAALTASAGPLTADAPDVEAALRSVHARMHDETATRVLPFPGERAVAGRTRPLGRWVVAGVAAAAAAAVVVQITRTEPAASVAAAGAPGSVITTGVGVRDSVRLPDGTRVILAPSSRLAVSPGYGRATREVTVQGMAWLSVRHDAALPFTLHLGSATVRDVGTEFTARSDDGDAGGIWVAVTEGSVELRAASSAAPVTLAAGDRGVVSADGRVVAERGHASDDDVAWTRGQLVFREAPMDRVRADIHRWYGVEVRVADSTLRARRITATFDGEPVDRVLQVVALAIGAVVERRDSVAVLRPGATR